jgi:hypothetical protein
MAVFSVLCGPVQFSDDTQCVAPNDLFVINIKFQMHVKWLLIYCYFIFKVNEVEMCFSSVHIFATCGKTEEQKMRLKLKLVISKIGDLDSPSPLLPCDGP